MMLEWLKPLCTKMGRRSSGIIDGFSSEFYIRFDCDLDPDTPEASGTCDIYLESITEDTRFRVVANAGRAKVLRFLFALGVEQLPEGTRKAMYGRNSVIRTMGEA